MGRAKRKERAEELIGATHQERILSKIFSLLVHLNNSKNRYRVDFNGFMFKVYRYNYSSKEYDILEEINLSMMDYADGYGELLRVQKFLKNMLTEN